MNNLLLFKKKETRLELSLIPLINVIFLLLIFFMVAGTMRHANRLPIELPIAQKTQSNQKSPTEIYIMMEEGKLKLAVNQDIVRKKDLPDIIKTILLSNEKQEMVVKADKDLPAYKLIDIMKIIEDLGVESVLLAAEVKE